MEAPQISKGGYISNHLLSGNHSQSWPQTIVCHIRTSSEIQSRWQLNCSCSCVNSPDPCEIMWIWIMFLCLRDRFKISKRVSFKSVGVPGLKHRWALWKRLVLYRWLVHHNYPGHLTCMGLECALGWNFPPGLSSSFRKACQADFCPRSRISRRLLCVKQSLLQMCCYIDGAWIEGACHLFCHC